MDDDDFVLWLSKRLRKRKSVLLKAMDFDCEHDQQGHKKKSLEVRQAIFDTWNQFSVVTVDRRNGRIR